MAPFEKAPLGPTGYHIGRLGYGSLNLGGRGTRAARIVDPAIAEQVLNGALDAGIDFIDTAPDYGEAEEVIGRYLSKRRSEYILASKCGCPVGALGSAPPPPGRPREHDYSPGNIRAGVEQSLGRMRTDYLDLVQVHESPSRALMEAEDSIAAMLQLKSEGKVRFLGISSTLPNVTEHLAMGVFDSFQVPYSALQLDYENIVRQAAAGGAGVIIRGGVAQGSVAISAAEAPTYRQDQVRLQNELWDMAALDQVLDGMSRMEFMLRFALTNPDVTTVVVGTANTGHLADNISAASRGPLPTSLYAEARQRLTAAGEAARAQREKS